MFGLFKKNPVAKLEKEYNSLLEQATKAQRSGDMALFAKLSSEADKVLKQINQLEKN